MPAERKLTAERLREVLCYDSETGVFTHRVTRSSRAVQGRVAGTTEKQRGYVRIRIDQKDYWAHTLAHLYVTGDWPEEDVDHVNGHKGDNRWENIRKASRSQNNANMGIPRHNTSGVKGVAWDRAKGMWRAQIKVSRKQIWLGYFRDIEDAKAAYAAAAHKYFGEFARAA